MQSREGRCHGAAGLGLSLIVTPSLVRCCWSGAGAWLRSPLSPGQVGGSVEVVKGPCKPG